VSLRHVFRPRLARRFAQSALKSQNLRATTMNVYAKPPAEPQDAPLYLRTEVSPEEIFKAIGRLRREAPDEIDRLIRFLDKTDDYVSRELEDSIDDNPHDEETDDNGEDNEDADPAEPSLASLGLTDQEGWSMGDRRDLEDEHDGAEPSENDEPSLGSFDGLMMDQEVCYLVSGAGMGVSTDAELDDADLSGIGDQDGLDEQVPFRDWQNIGMV